MTKGVLTARLKAAGWQRVDAPAEEVGECTDPTGCSKAGRWTHPYVDGAYCAQHAGQTLGGHDSRMRGQ
jgi:hypothetical protein